MPALNFRKQFAPLVAARTKCQTIRRPRKRPIKKGDMLFFYSGQRTKACRYLGSAVCQGAGKVSIRLSGVVLASGPFSLIFLDPSSELEDFARTDGFESWKEMRGWFEGRYGLPFDGKLIIW